MAGESDLSVLLREMEPVRRPGEFVLVSLPDDPGVDCEALVREDEGVTVVVRRELADERGWAYDFIAAWLSLRVHSDLAAVGLTAAISAALAREGISANVIAGYFHDHLLVPADRAMDALAALEALAS